jgi:hypothetical protein
MADYLKQDGKGFVIDFEETDEKEGFFSLNIYIDIAIYM